MDIFHLEARLTDTTGYRPKKRLVSLFWREMQFSCKVSSLSVEDCLTVDLNDCFQALNQPFHPKCCSVGLEGSVGDAQVAAGFQSKGGTGIQKGYL